MAIPPSELNLKDAVEYHYDAFPPQTIDHKQIIPALFNAVDAIARFDQMLKGMHNSEILLAPLRNQEAVISSRMEGTVSTMDEILRYEADKEEESGASPGTRSEVIETVLYRIALTAAQQEMEKGADISQWLIRAIHEKLLSFGRGAQKSPGRYKNEQNYLVDNTRRNVRFVPVRPEKQTDALETLFRFLETSNENILIKIALAHVEFEAIHPFKDGNGRIGRMLITLMLWKANVISKPHFYVSSYLEENKDLYVDMMRRVSSEGAWTQWCVFFLEALEKQAIRNLAIAEEINSIYNEMKEIFRETLSSKWHVNALDYMFTNPIFRNNKFTRDSGIPAQTAIRFSRRLESEGLLKVLEVAAGRRAALYSFEPLLRALRV